MDNIRNEMMFCICRVSSITRHLGRCIIGRSLRPLSIALVGIVLANGQAYPQTFDEASATAITTICDNRTAPNGETTGTGKFHITANFNDNVCNNRPSGGLFSSPAGGTTQGAGSQAIEERLQSVREAEEERREAAGAGRDYASKGDGVMVAANGQLQLPPAGGGVREVFVAPGRGFGAFIATGATVLLHSNNRFEDGYDAVLPAVTVGADVWITPQFLVGLAMNYTYFDATFDDGGGFDKHIFGPQLYATVLPFPGAFADVVLGYSRGENENTRHVFGQREGGAPPITGHASADYGENVYWASLLSGYDYPLAPFTVGPRVGLAFAYAQVNDIKENGDTALELKYSGLNQTSVQSSLGVLASVRLDRSWGVLVPQVSAAWGHEYAGDARRVDAEYVDSSPSPVFKFNREKVARDWAMIGVGAVGQLENGLQPFASFTTMQGNANFTSYGATIGLRIAF